MKLAIILSALVAVAFGTVIPHFGFPEEDTSRGSRIVNGEEAEKGEAPYIASLTQTAGGSHFCAAIILKDKVLLTAAHCCISSTFYASAGMNDRNKPAQTIKVVECIKHEKYGGGVGPNDIALLRLESPLKLSSTVAVIKLPTQLPSTNDYGKGVLYGWGRNAAGSLPINLFKMDSDLLSASVCKDKLPFGAPIATTNICTSSMNEGKSACNGDSGGPLIKIVNDEALIVGIVSWGYVPCGVSNYPSVYTCVVSHLDWIGKNMPKY